MRKHRVRRTECPGNPSLRSVYSVWCPHRSSSAAAQLRPSVSARRYNSRPDGICAHTGHYEGRVNAASWSLPGTAASIPQAVFAQAKKRPDRLALRRGPLRRNVAHFNEGMAIRWTEGSAYVLEVRSAEACVSDRRCSPWSWQQRILRSLLQPLRRRSRLPGSPNSIVRVAVLGICGSLAARRHGDRVDQYYYGGLRSTRTAVRCCFQTKAHRISD
jgi:hypothetical protein